MSTSTRAVRLLLAAAAIYYIGTFVVVAFLRISYPFQLEICESEIIHEIEWLLQGHKLYVEPSLQYIPVTYHPFYFYLVAPLMKIFEVNFLAPRLLSLLFTLGSFIFIFFIVKTETRSALWGLVTAGLFAACYKIGGTWYDLARVDSMFIFFTLAAVYLIRFHETQIANILAGLCLVVAYFTKQTALTVALPLLLYALIVRKKHSSYLIVTTLSLMAIITFILHNLYGKWYWFYCFEEYIALEIISSRYYTFWTQDMFARVGLITLLAVGFFYSQFRHSPKKIFWFYLLFSGGMILGSWMSRLHSGNFENCSIPAYIAVAIVAPLACWAIGSDGEARKSFLPLGFYILCLLQFFLLFYNPNPLIPTQADRAAGYRFLARLQEYPGDVYIPQHEYLAKMVGKPVYAHFVGVADALNSKDQPVIKKLIREFNQALRDQKFYAIITYWDPARAQTDKDSYLKYLDFKRYYTFDSRMFKDRFVFWTRAGLKSRPDYIYLASPNSSLLPNHQ